MLSNDFYLFDAGWLFFAAWSVILAIVTATAFTGDLFLLRARLQLAQQDQSSSSAGLNGKKV